MKTKDEFISNLINILMNEGYTLESIHKLLVESYGYDKCEAYDLLGII